MKTTNKIVIIVALITGMGCTSMSGSLVIGAGSGAALGAASGLHIGDKDQSKKNTSKGAVIGAAVGGLTGYLFHLGVKKREAKIRRDTIFNLERNNVDAPIDFKGKSHGIQMPVIESEYVDEAVTEDGKHLIESHRVWKVREQVRFAPRKKDWGQSYEK